MSLVRTPRGHVRRGVVAAACLACLLLVGALLGGSAARAHPLDAATLSLTEVSEGRFVVRWQTGSEALQEDVRSPAVFPSHCRYDGRTLDCGRAGLAGALSFPWLEGTLIRLVVEVTWLGDHHLLRIVTASSPPLTLYGAPGAGRSSLGYLRPLVADYTRLGIEHILGGLDHVLFVIALTLLVRGRRMLLCTITAFTVAHSLTLAATALGLLELPSPPVEACIALSIVLVAAACVRPRGEAGLTGRAPWFVAFVFGLLHGMGFASALLQMGLPQNHLPLALLFFNVGVEVGQLGIIAALALIGAVVRRFRLERPWFRPGIAYAMGTVAAYWSWERMAAVVGF